MDVKIHPKRLLPIKQQTSTAGKSVKCTRGALIQNTAAGSNFRPTGLVSVS